MKIWRKIELEIAKKYPNLPKNNDLAHKSTENLQDSAKSLKDKDQKKL